MRERERERESKESVCTLNNPSSTRGMKAMLLGIAEEERAVVFIQCVGLESVINLMHVLFQNEIHERGCKSFGETIFLWLLLGSKILIIYSTNLL